MEQAAATTRIPEGDVLIRRVRGPAQATNVYLGLVRTGRIYCTDVETAVVLCGEGGEFEPEPAYRAQVEARKQAAGGGRE